MTSMYGLASRARAKSVIEAYALMPKEGLLPDFMATFLPTTDCSCTLLFGAALSLAATFLNRRVWITQGDRRVHPNLWNALIATSGERKSTAVNIVAKILKQDSDYAGICLASDSTWPAIAARLGFKVQVADNGEPDWDEARQSCKNKPNDWIKGVGTFCIDEIGGWLKSLNKTVNEGLRETLTGIYECPPEWAKETKTAGCYYIWRPCVSILAASTASWFADNSSEADLAGGFLGRWLFFVSNGHDYKLPHCDQPDTNAERRLCAWIDQLKALHGEVAVSDEAWKAYSLWFKEFELPERLASFRPRLENAALKIALIYEATQGERTIRPETMQQAIQVVDWLAAQIESFAKTKLIFDKAERRMARVQQILSSYGEIRRGELIHKVHPVSKDELAEYLATWIAAEKVVQSQKPGSTATYYRWVG